jgi:hypothetical protein
MDDTITACTAYGEAVVFLNYFNDLPDPRQQGKVTYPLDEILLLCLPSAPVQTFDLGDDRRFRRHPVSVVG